MQVIYLIALVVILYCWLQPYWAPSHLAVSLWSKAKKVLSAVFSCLLCHGRYGMRRVKPGLVIHYQTPKIVSWRCKACTLWSMPGAAIGPSLGLSAGMTGNPLAFFTTALSYFALGVAVLFFRRNPKQNAQSYNPMRFGQTLFLLKKDQLFLLVIVANILVTFIYAHCDSSLIQYLTRAEVPELVALISAMIILNSSVIVLFQFPLLRLMAGWPVVSRIYVGLLLLAASQLGFALNPPQWFWGWIAAVFVLSLGEAILFANMNVHLDQLAPASLRGSYFGAASLYAIGYSLSPVLGGVILDLWGGPALFAISFSLCLAVFISYRHSGKLQAP